MADWNRVVSCVATENGPVVKYAEDIGVGNVGQYYRAAQPAVPKHWYEIMVVINKRFVLASFNELLDYPALVNRVKQLLSQTYSVPQEAKPIGIWAGPYKCSQPLTWNSCRTPSGGTMEILVAPAAQLDFLTNYSPSGKAY